MDYMVDTAGVEENTGKFKLLPEDVYDARIVEKSDAVTGNGDPMVKIKLEIITAPYNGQWVFDNIVIPLPGSKSFGIMGRTLHFLHVIGQPYKGQFRTNSDKWIHQCARVKVVHEIAKKGKYAGKPVAKVQSYDFFKAVEDDAPDAIFDE